MKRNKNRYISHPPQRDDAKEARAEVVDLRVYHRSFSESERDTSTKGCDVSLWVTTAASPFTTFGGRDPNCFGYNAIFRRIWANGKGMRRVDN